MPALASSTIWRITRPKVDELREPLLRLWHRNLPDATRDRFEWLYGSGCAEALLLGEPQVIGSAGLMHRRFAINGEVVEAGAAIDLNVDESQRSVGPALTLARSVLQAADDDGLAGMYGFPIRRAAGVLIRCGYRQIGAVSNWTKVLRSEAQLQRKLKFSVAAKLAAPLVDVALRFKNSDGRHRLPRGVSTESVKVFDERFDRLWQTVAQRGGIIGERSVEYLTWRFTNCPDLRYECMALSRHGKLLGYVVWYRSGDSVCIADLLATDDLATQLLLAEFTRMARRLKADVIRVACFAPPSFYALLQSAGFSRRLDSHPVLVRMPPATGDWYLTMADHDTDV